MDFGAERQSVAALGRTVVKNFVTVIKPVDIAAQGGKPSLSSVELWFVILTPDQQTKSVVTKVATLFVVGGGGFEPPKSETSDLQSDAFGHSAIRPILIFYPA